MLGKTVAIVIVLSVVVALGIFWFGPKRVVPSPGDSANGKTDTGSGTREIKVPETDVPDAPETGSGEKSPEPEEAGPVIGPAPRPETDGSDEKEPGVPTYNLKVGQKGVITFSEQGEGTGVARVEIWLSADEGKSWTKYSRSRRTKGRLTYRAEEVGTFDFVTVGIDRLGYKEKELGEDTVPQFRVVVAPVDGE